MLLKYKADSWLRILNSFMVCVLFGFQALLSSNRRFCVLPADSGSYTSESGLDSTKAV